MKLRADNPNQNRDELVALVKIAQAMGCRKYLEIGSRHGDSLYAVVANMARGGLAVSVDREGDALLFETRDELNAMGYACMVICESSQSELAINLVKSVAPFDLVMIDGDHNYSGVLADWNNYGRLGWVTALHDIANPENPDVGKLWGEIKKVPTRIYEEIVAPGSNMGYGIVKQLGPPA